MSFSDSSPEQMLPDLAAAAGASAGGGGGGGGVFSLWIHLRNS